MKATSSIVPVRRSFLIALAGMPAVAASSRFPAAVLDGIAIDCRQFGLYPNLSKKEQTAALVALINHLKRKRGGRVNFPAGTFTFDAWTIQSATSEDIQEESRHIHFVGAGGRPGFPGTRFDMRPSSKVEGAIKLVSLSHSSFTGIEFFAGNDQQTSLIKFDAHPNPVFSSYSVAFNQCSFHALNSERITAAIRTLIQLTNAVDIEFNQCWSSGDCNVMQFGELMGRNTAAGNGCGNIRVNGGYWTGDFRMVNCLGVSFKAASFGKKRNNKPASFFPSDDDLSRIGHIAFENCNQISQNGYLGHQDPFYRQGKKGFGLTVIGGEYGAHQVAFLIDGRGGASFIGGVKFRQPRDTNNKPRAWKNTAIQIEAGVQLPVSYSAINVERLWDGDAAPIVDKRVLPFPPYVAHVSLTARRKLSATAGQYEPILEVKSVKLRGGRIRVSYMLYVTSTEPQGFSSRVEINQRVVPGTAVHVGTTFQNQLVTLSSNVMATHAADKNAAIVLVLRRSSASAATVAADELSSVYLMVEEVE